MNKDKSIFEKITDKVKDIATIAADAANEALKAEEPPLKAEERTAAYIPLAADGIVSDPMMVPPTPVAPTRRRRKPAAPKRNAKASRKTARSAIGKSAAKTAKKSAAKRSKKTAKKAAKKARKRSRA
jgi:hypothetical protein